MYQGLPLNVANFKRTRQVYSAYLNRQPKFDVVQDGSFNLMKQGDKLLRILFIRKIWEKEPDKYLQYDSDEEAKLVEGSGARAL